MSFYIGGELDITRINRDSFANAASEIGLSKNMVLKSFDDMAGKVEAALGKAAEKMAGEGFDNAVKLKDEILICGGYRNL